MLDKNLKTMLRLILDLLENVKVSFSAISGSVPIFIKPLSHGPCSWANMSWCLALLWVGAWPSSITTLRWFSGIPDGHSTSFPYFSECLRRSSRCIRYVPYVTKKEEPYTRAIKEVAIRPRFRVSCKELLSIPGVADKLKFPKEKSLFEIMKRCLMRVSQSIWA